MYVKPDILYDIGHDIVLMYFALSGAAPIVPNSDEEEDGDWQMDADDLRDYLEQDTVPHQLPPAGYWPVTICQTLPVTLHACLIGSI